MFVYLTDNFLSGVRFLFSAILDFNCAVRKYTAARRRIFAAVFKFFLNPSILYCFYLTFCIVSSESEAALVSKCLNVYSAKLDNSQPL